MVIRPATIDDAEPIEQVRLAGWRAAYGPLLAPDALAAIDIGDWTQRRSRLIVAGSGRYLVADDGGVIGFCAYGRSRDDDVDSDELYALYVAPTRWSTGAGRALLAAALHEVDGPMHLWVLAANARARAFYERAGFEADGASKPIDLLGTVLDEVRYRRGHG